MDITVTAPLAAAHKNKVQGANAQANVAKTRKNTEYKAKAEQANIIFLPAVDGFINLMKEVFQVKDAKTRDPQDMILYKYMMTGISVVMQKGLVNAFAKRKMRSHGDQQHASVTHHYNNNYVREYAENMRNYR